MTELDFLRSSVSIKGRDTKLDLEGVEKSVCFLDCWFIKASWTYKKNFLMSCIEHLDKEGLEEIVLLLGPPVKDYYYSLSGYTNSEQDIIPQDDNRQLDKTMLDLARDSDFVWLTGLPNQHCVYILIGLTELSGSALRMQLYERAFFLLTEFQVEEYSVEEDKVEEVEKEKNEFYDDVDKSSPEYQSYKENLEKYNEFIKKLRGKLKKGNTSDKQSSSTKKSAKENSSQDSLDYIQILPSWITRQILSYLDEGSLKTCQKVNSYWKNAIKQLKKEREVRSKLDDIIENLQPGDMKSRKKSKSKKESKKQSPEGKPGSKNKKAKECQEIIVEEYLDSPQRTEMINTFINSKNRLAFRKRHILIWTFNEFTYNRVLAVGKSWFAFSRGAEIVLCNLLSFANLPGTIDNDGKVAAMVFHPKNGQLITAGADSIIRRWEVWGRREMHSFNFPSPNNIVANENYYAVTGSAIIKVYRWEMNACQWTEELDEPNTINTVTITQDDTIYISYLPENNIKRVCASNGTVLLEILNPSEGKYSSPRITSLYHHSSYCITSNEEGLVNIWKSDEEEPLLLAGRNFQRKINNVILREGCIMVGTDKGEFQIWDVATDEIIHSTTINEDAMPILDIHFLNYSDHCKVILNSEIGIKVLEFIYEKKIMKKNGFASPQTCRSLPQALTNSDKLITFRGRKKEEIIKEQMLKRQSCHPTLRKDLEKILTIKESYENRLRQDLDVLRYFPSIFSDPEKQPNKLLSSAAKDDNPKQTKPSDGKQQIPFKKLLPIHNPYKHRFQFK